MTVKKIPSGMFQSNCYIVGDSGEAAVIDPGVEAARILREAEALGLKIVLIALTHAHIDHMVAIEDLRKATGAPTVVHRLDARFMADAWGNGSRLFGRGDKFSAPDREVEDGDTALIGGLALRFLHTPGHTPGGMCILADGQVFTGDTLFYRNIGNTSLGHGNEEDLLRSIREKLLTLPPETVVQPGHGVGTTIGYERENNPWL